MCYVCLVTCANVSTKATQTKVAVVYRLNALETVELRHVFWPLFDAVIKTDLAVCCNQD